VNARRFFASFGPVLVLHGLLATLLFQTFPRAPHARFQDVIERVTAFVKDRTATADACARSHPLCRLYLGDRTKVPATFRRDFQASGLSHLLALSGGQTGPIAALACAVLLFPLVIALGVKRCLGLRKILSHLRHALTFAFTLAAAFLYGASGALLRAPLVSLPLGRFCSSSLGALLARVCVRFTLIAFLSLWLGGAFHNLSFLLSALGCECLFLATRAEKILDEPVAMILPRPVLSGVFLTVGTSLLMACVLAPYSTTDFAASALANILAVPLVTVVVTPLSFARLALSAWPWLSPTDAFTSALDAAFSKSLALLSHFARLFSGEGGTLAFGAIRSGAGPVYLATLLVVLWSIRDAAGHMRTRELHEAFRALPRIPPH